MRIGREVDDLNADGFAKRYDASIVVSAQVIEDEDIARIEPGQELSGEPENEAVLVGAGEHRAEHDPAGQSDCAEEREVLSPVHRYALDVLGPLLHPRVRPGHRRVEPRLIKENELGDRYAANLPKKDLALGDYVRPKLLDRAEPFFLTTYPARWRARLMLETCRRFLPRRPRLYRAVISPAFGSPRAATIPCNSSRDTFERFPPALGCGRKWPSRRYCHTHRFRLAMPTLNRAATVRNEPSPLSYASTTRFRSSTGCASAIQIFDQISLRCTSRISSIEQRG